jgi:peptidase E
MKLFLASYISHPDTQKRLINFMGGYKDKKIAYIPTAANGEDGWEKWKTNSSTWKMVSASGAEVEPIQLEDYKEDEIGKKLENKDVIWVAGGMTGYLAYWAKRRYLDKILPAILEKGTIYVGSSAGAMLVGQTTQASEFEFTDKERGASLMEPLRIVDFDIFPHYKDEYLDLIKSEYKGSCKLYLLKDGEEIIVEDGRVMITGEERVVTND